LRRPNGTGRPPALAICRLDRQEFIGQVVAIRLFRRESQA
jgi:hypothetical protein